MKLLEALQGIGIDKEEIDQPLFQKKESKAVVAEKEEKQVTETDFLIFHNIECPCCSNNFKFKKIKAKSLRIKEQTINFRTIYYNIEPLKYQNIMCPHCGYTANGSFFQSLSDRQIKLLRDYKLQSKIAGKLAEMQKDAEVEKQSGSISPTPYDEAVLQYKMALLCCIIKGAGDLEKGLTCLKLVWLYESQDIFTGDEYTEACTNAVRGLESAFLSEYLNERILNEVTCQLLIASLYDRMGDYTSALKWLSNIIVSSTTSSKMKDKAREYRDYIKEKSKS